MEVQGQIDTFKELFEMNYINNILQNVRNEHNSISFDFNELAVFNPELAELLLENPENTLRAAELAIESIDLGLDEQPNIIVRVFNLPAEHTLLIKNIRSKHIGKFIELGGIVRQKSDVRPQVTSAVFECPSCGNRITVLQLDTKFREPTSCGCGRKGKFRLLSKELVDAQRIVLEEAPEDIEGGEQPKRLDIILKQDLVSPITERKTNPGAKITVTGILKEVPIITRDGSKSTRFDLLIEANHVQSIQEEFADINLTEEEIKEIRDLSKDPSMFKKIIESMAPTIYGLTMVKQALLLQMVGGVRKKRNDGTVTRGDIHILLIGDPGAGKSMILQRVVKIAPKVRFVSGKGASGAGLTASVVKDEFIRGWALEAGALVLANKGICCIDEFDKMTKEDSSAMHEALEQQTITIAKANIHATLRAETTVLAAANPKYDRFDPYESIGSQINFPSTILNRFDLIFPIKDNPRRDVDEKLAGFILRLHQDQEANIVTPLTTEFIKKYIAYAKRTSKPKLTDIALKEIQEYYVKMRMTSGEEGRIKSIPISPRQLEALVRLSEASAKLRLDDKVLKKDARVAIELVHHCLTQIGLDPSTGKIDIDRFRGGISASQRSYIKVIKDTINEMEARFGKVIPVAEIIKAAKEKDIEGSRVTEVIDRLKRSGDLFMPKNGFISKL
jgi:replicative DNA helicase Mcm